MYEFNAGKFSDDIREARGARYLREIAAIAGVHRVTLGDYERRKHEPATRVMLNLCGALGLSPSRYFEGDRTGLRPAHSWVLDVSALQDAVHLRRGTDLPSWGASSWRALADEGASRMSLWRAARGAQEIRPSTLATLCAWLEEPPSVFFVEAAP